MASLEETEREARMGNCRRGGWAVATQALVLGAG